MKAILILIAVIVAAGVSGSIGYIAAPEKTETVTVQENVIVQENVFVEVPVKENSVFVEGNYLVIERVISWDSARTALGYAGGVVDSAYDNGSLTLNHYLLIRAYYHQQLANFENDLDAIDNLTGSEWDASLNKFGESLYWDIRSFDNNTLYRQTTLDTYYQASLVAYQNTISATTEAWNLMPT